MQVVRGLEGSEHVFLAEDELGGEDGEDVLEVLHRVVVHAALRCVMLAREVHRVVVVDPISLKSVYQVVSYLLRNEIRFVGHGPCRPSDANGDVFVRRVENGLGWEKVCGEEEEEEEGGGKRC